MRSSPIGWASASQAEQMGSIPIDRFRILGLEPYSFTLAQHQEGRTSGQTDKRGLVTAWCKRAGETPQWVNSRTGA